MKSTISSEKLLSRAEKIQREESEPNGGCFWLEERCNKLASALRERDDDYRLHQHLRWTGHSAARRCAQAVMTGISTDGSAIRDGWTLQKLACRFRERDLVASLQEFRTLEDLGEQSSLDVNYYWDFNQVVWGQFAVGLSADWQEGLDILTLCEMRGQGVLPSRHDYAEMPLALNNLLRADRPSAAHFQSFINAAPFQKLADSWSDDQAFRVMLLDACDWHLRRTYPSDFYHSGFALFPSWLLALNRYRQERTNKSSLPDHPLMVYGKRILAANFDGPTHPLVIEAEAEYARRYADKPVDFEAEWRAFLNQSKGPRPH